MMQQIRKAMGTVGDNKGFTLVEMALVLIIIGIIIGAVVKGKDLVRGAEQKRIYSKFLSEWRLAYLNFYDRTGRILGDTWDTTTAANGQDGQADTDPANTGTPSTAGQTALSAGDTVNTPPLYRGLAQVGLDSPVTNVPGTPYQYRYTDSGGNSHVLNVYFAFQSGASSYNYMLITNIPTELAMALDTMIDGEAVGTSTTGDFFNDTGVNDWGNNPTTVVTNGARWRMKF